MNKEQPDANEAHAFAELSAVFERASILEERVQYLQERGEDIHTIKYLTSVEVLELNSVMSHHKGRVTLFYSGVGFVPYLADVDNEFQTMYAYSDNLKGTPHGIRVEHTFDMPPYIDEETIEVQNATLAENEDDTDVIDQENEAEQVGLISVSDARIAQAGLHVYVEFLADELRSEEHVGGFSVRSKHLEFIHAMLATELSILYMETVDEDVLMSEAERLVPDMLQGSFNYDELLRLYKSQEISESEWQSLSGSLIETLNAGLGLERFKMSILTRHMYVPVEGGRNPHMKKKHDRDDGLLIRCQPLRISDHRAFYAYQRKDAQMKTISSDGRAGLYLVCDVDPKQAISLELESSIVWIPLHDMMLQDFEFTE
ncbi:MAG TPA: hypothetical protein PKD20_03735 [Candidatus Saccharibacteria bacterium]|jgi:hypothetical protein|nr:hypothetical protein [Candidatus Saccharibacteria bacterium]HMT55964.1 hypothetical protein [Candidatus Saccharibacteria bacterium]